MKNFQKIKSLYLLLFFICFNVNSQNCEIIGPPTITPNGEASYSINLDEGSQYFWSVQGDLQLTSGQSTNEISVIAGSTSPSTGKVCVTRFKDSTDPCCDCIDVGISNMGPSDPVCCVNVIASCNLTGNQNQIIVNPNIQICNPYAGYQNYTFSISYNGGVVHSGNGTIPGNQQSYLNESFVFNIPQNAIFPLDFQITVVLSDLFDNISCSVNSSFEVANCSPNTTVNCSVIGKFNNCKIAKGGNSYTLTAYILLQNPFNNAAEATLSSSNIGYVGVTVDGVSHPVFLVSGGSLGYINITQQFSGSFPGSVFQPYIPSLIVTYTDLVTLETCTATLEASPLDSCNGPIDGTLDPRVNNSNDFYISPNPVMDFLKLELISNLDYDHIEIYDLNGRKVKDEKINSDNIYNVDTLSSGVYLLNVLKSNSTIHRVKFIKK